MPLKENAQRFGQVVDEALSARAHQALLTARLTQLIATLFILFDMHKDEKVQLRSAWRPHVTLFKKDWGDDATPCWLAAKYDCVRALR